MKRFFQMGILLLAAATTAAQAEVRTIVPNGFAIEQTVALDVSVKQAWDALLQVGHWWNPEHTYSGVAANLRIEARAGGCFCERLKKGSVEHMRVAWLQEDRVLRLRGALGPLQADGVDGALTWTLRPHEGGSVLKLEYVVGGYSPTGFDKWAPLVDQVLAEQMARLQKYLQTGKPG